MLRLSALLGLLAGTVRAQAQPPAAMPADRPISPPDSAALSVTPILSLPVPSREADSGHLVPPRREDDIAGTAPEPVAGGPLCRCGAWLVEECSDHIGRSWRDIVTMYTGRHLCCLGLALAVAAPLANTDADQAVADWYRDQARSPRTDEWANVGNWIGRHQYTVPLYLGAMALGALFDDTMPGEWTYEWSNRTLRAMTVGAIAVGALQYGLGASRPVEGDSHWHPFRDNNSVAGHVLIGAVPFLAAAAGTERPALKVLFVAGSFWTAWARMNHEAHYLSQVVLGWSIAYLSMQSVLDTDRREQRFQFTPVEQPDGIGLGFRWLF